MEIMARNGHSVQGMIEINILVAMLIQCRVHVLTDYSLCISNLNAIDRNNIQDITLIFIYCAVGID